MKQLFSLLVVCALAAPCQATIMSGLYDLDTSDVALDADLGLPVVNQTLTPGATETFNGTFALVNFNLTGSTLTLNIESLVGLLTPTITLRLHTLDLGGDTITGVTETSGLGATIDDSNLAGFEFSVTTPVAGLTGANTLTFEIADSSSTPIPEPSSCALFLVGGLAAWRIRRKRAA